IGVYTIGLRAEIAPTSRLLHLGLCSEAGMLPPLDNHSLLALAAAGQLTTLDGDVLVPVRLSVQGQGRLGIAAPAIAQRNVTHNGQVGGSTHGSPNGTRDGSSNWRCETPVSAGQDSQNSTSDIRTSLIAWDVGMIHESINHDTASDHMLAEGGGEAVPDTA